MSDLPVLTPGEVATVVTSAKEIEPIGSGGQKVVFRARIDGGVYALKFALLPPDVESDDLSSSDVAARAAREVETMRDCSSPFMVKLGPVGLTFVTIGHQKLLYFSEEFVDGDNLRTLLDQQGTLAPSEVVQLGIQISSAIQELWALGKIHRDIKPGNIMRRRQTGDFVLLDAGLAFDVAGESLSAGFLVGTKPYFSPEQFDYNSRRILDFRSDMFSLGVTLYEALTGRHPFWVRGDSSPSLFTKIRTHNPPAPGTIMSRVPPPLDRVVLRMLGKFPHLRYRKCEQLIAALREVQAG